MQGFQRIVELAIVFVEILMNRQALNLFFFLLNVHVAVDCFLRNPAEHVVGVCRRQFDRVCPVVAQSPLRVLRVGRRL